MREYVASNVAVPEELRPQRVAVLCVGNRLMLDDGVGPAVYDELMASYDIPDNVELLDLGCLSLAMIDRVREFDVIVTVDAVDDSGQPAGTVLRYAPDAMARHVGITASYLSNLFSKQVGMKFVDYLNEVRIDHACTYLRQNYLKNYEIAYKVGFRDEKYFSKVFRRVMDMTPSEYKAGKNVAG